MAITSTHIKWSATAIGAMAIVAAIFWLPQRQIAALAPLPPVTIAMPTQISSAPMIVANAQGLFKTAGVQVITQPFLLGKDALASMLEGKADLAIVADTPLMNAVLADQDVAILAAISQSRRALAIVAHSSSGINTIPDLIGKSITMPQGTNQPYFLDAMLRAHGVGHNKLNTVDLKVPEGIAAFKAGSVDAIVVFQPFLAQLEADLGNKIKVFYGHDVYAFRFLLVGKPAYIQQHEPAIQRVLQGLIAGTQTMRTHPDIARLAVGAAVKVGDTIMQKIWDPQDFAITLDQGLLLALEDQTRWAMQRGLVKPGTMPNYLNVMRFEPLETVMPSAVKITH
ncbi:MAG: NrtA/SsuA/CpmA family ABC transporter substrate-binding protein [Aquabacterium sp.]|nr:NrtA/SsuA/CpmA family ABC transporter substrate-binding protein [Aquabacterium sp.]